MASPGEKALLLLFLFHAVSALYPDTMSPMSPMVLDPDPETPGFPSPPARFQDMAKKLMMRCLQMGHLLPMTMDNPFNNSGVQMEDSMSRPNPLSHFHSLLTSLSAEETDTYSDTDMDSASRFYFQPNSTMKYPDSDREWNVTERMWNCSSLPSFIEHMRNSSAGPQCFLRAFIAPLSWVALMMKGGDDMEPEDYGSLVWAAKPLLQNMPPLQMTLPPWIQNPHLEEMMKMLGEVFGSLSEEQRVQIREWAKEQVAQNNYNCSHTAAAWRPRPIPEQKPGQTHRPEQKPGQTHRPGQEPGQTHRPAQEPGQTPKPEQEPRQTLRPEVGQNWPARPPQPDMTVMPSPCPPRLLWLKMDVMKMMGPFLSGLPMDDIQTITNDQLCPFFHSPQFPSSFRGVGGLPPLQGRKILQKIRECSQKRGDLVQNLDRLGSLACFYDDAPTLNSSMSRLLLSQLDDCSNSGVNKLKKKLVNTVMSSSVDDSSPELLRALGPGVTLLSPFHLSQFSPDALKDTLMSLGSDVKWGLTQAKTLVNKLLQGKQEVSGKELMSLASAVTGVASSVLRKVKSQGLLGNEGLDMMSQKMTSLQRKALLEGLLGDVNASELIQKVPASLLSSLSLTTLDKANLTSLDQLEGKQWTRAQSAFLVRNILGKKMTLTDMRKLGSAMQGVSCEMIEKVMESGVMEMAQAVTENPRWLSKTQVCCTAQSLFAGLEKKRAGYFNNITDAELEEIPTLLLLHLPAEKIASLPASVCAVFMKKMKEANLSSLPLTSRSRPTLTNRALNCLGRNMSKLSSEEVLSLGSLLCELAPSQMSLLAPEVLNSSVQALVSCKQIPPRHWRALFQLLNDTYGDPSDWTADTIKSLGPLLLLDDSAVRSLRFKSWLKETLSDLMDSLPSPPVPNPPQEFSRGPDLSALRWKLFSLSTSTSEVMPMRRRRAVLPQGEAGLTVSLLEELGGANVYWSPAQLSKMDAVTITAAVETLGEVLDYSSEQLVVLREKAIQAWGPVSGLNESQVFQLGCVSQGFNLTELASLPFSSLDTLETLSRCSWTQPQREAVWRGFVERINETVGELGAVELVGLDQFICGLNTEETGQLNTDAFREAVQSVGEVQCPLAVTELLKQRAVAVFGETQGWTEARVNSLGNIMAGLSLSEFLSLSPSAFSFLSQTSVPLIPPDRLAALSTSQLKALGPDNAAMVTSAQWAVLGEAQRAALGNALGVAYDRVAYDRAEPTTNPPRNLPQLSGASMLGTLGVGVFMQPFLFLLLGFVL
ncbi:otoancorin-like [Oncorhynchus keta]|uniref:otoancorin-like n=1 Tax=Oncorhynchus keta TaxID=8018 RepID=UPI00227B7F5A|nr:otoancorin-like [Oncorhynchus keta]XP_052358563.1 otoancorin-like [Oncorhynchus keta]